MARKIFFFIVIGIISATVITFFPRTEKAQASVNLVDEVARQQVLAATVQITVYANDTSDDGSPTTGVAQYTLGDGLGTLVQDGQNTYIVTHDHWSRLVKNLHKAQFHDANGQLLLELDRALFYGLIRYRDGGTMVLEAPEQIAAQLTAVQVNKNASIAAKQTLLIAFWQPEAEQQISVEPVSVELIESYEGQPAIKMRSLNGRIVVQGNSGGGVYSEGQLVGTMWETIVQRHLVNGESTGETNSTDMSRAALAVYEIESESDLAGTAAEQSLNRGEI